MANQVSVIHLAPQFQVIYKFTNTNWAKQLPIHVVKELAGHSDIKTTQSYYLSVQPEDITKAQKVQEALLGKIPKTDLTDPKVTHFGKKRVFPGQQGCQRKMQSFD